ncbi:hypothetical protein VP01_3382g1 [Puccinia sorghi]|uniref:Uncharacterized protein n=1 Tax=Puccinia sorghi TaxID=27349 RepID=A0A0L6UXM6_9BASI|nr:hypothetical protein VP01_3382g1 [Puccinia sorghi]
MSDLNYLKGKLGKHKKQNNRIKNICRYRKQPLRSHGAQSSVQLARKPWQSILRPLGGGEATSCKSGGEYHDDRAPLQKREGTKSTRTTRRKISKSSQRQPLQVSTICITCNQHRVDANPSFQLSQEGKDEREAGRGVRNPPPLLGSVISSFRLIKTFLSWREAISRLDGWNPYKERTMAKNLADLAKEKNDEISPQNPNHQFKYIRAKTPPEEQSESIKERFRRYKIPKKKSQPKYKAAAPVPQASNNKVPPTQCKNKPSNLPKHKKRKVVHQTVDKEEEEEKWRQVADFSRAFNGIKQILDN